MSILDDLASVSANLADDLNVSEDTYKDSTPPAPVPEGNYRLRLEVEIDKDKDGKVKGQLDDKGRFFPTVLIKKGEVIEGPEGTLGRNAISYARIYTRPFDRQGSLASSLADLTRSFDQTRGWAGVEEGIKVLAELAATGTCRLKLQWEAFDKDYAEELANELGGFSSLNAAQKKEINKKATVKGAKNFDANGIAIGKTGATLEARTRITTTYPSAKDGVKIG